MTKLRIATFNVENLDIPTDPESRPTLEERIPVLRPQLHRLRADIICFQEVHSQKEGRTRKLTALRKLLEGTRYEKYHMVHTTATPKGKVPMPYRNLVIVSKYPIVSSRQIKHDYVPAPVYQMVSANPPAAKPSEVTWERPFLHAVIELPDGQHVNVINVHLKSKLPTPIPGGKVDRFTWASKAAAGEGSFLSSMKRVGQAAEVTVFIDTLFDAEPEALIVVCGDYNCDFDEVATKMIRGMVEEHGNPALLSRELIPCETSVSPGMRYSILHHGQGRMFDHLMVSRALLHYYVDAKVLNETLKDESIAFATDDKYPGSDHAPVVAEFCVDEH
jgi:endonuclease/exonuclease/phosphatase family metal-dependent hydrolase